MPFMSTYQKPFITLSVTCIDYDFCFYLCTRKQQQQQQQQRQQQQQQQQQQQEMKRQTSTKNADINVITKEKIQNRGKTRGEY
jgi:hypothetical protein